MLRVTSKSKAIRTSIGLGYVGIIIMRTLGLYHANAELAFVISMNDFYYM